MQVLLPKSQAFFDAVGAAIIWLDKDLLVAYSNASAQSLLRQDISGLAWSTLQAEYGLQVLKSSALDGGQLLTVATVNPNNINTLGSMVASLAHQIKTPLATAMLYAQLLLDKALPPAKAEGYIIKVNERLRTLNQIIDSLMILIKGITPKPAKLALKDLKDDLLQYVNDKKLYVDFEFLLFDLVTEQVFINCDAKTLVSGIGNLINNSIEATTSLAKILILLTVEERFLQITVSDKGPGIPEHYKNKLFEPFVSSKVTGTGLGLSILQIIVQSYQGSVAIESAHSFGTKVIIKLPLLIVEE